MGVLVKENGSHFTPAPCAICNSIERNIFSHGCSGAQRQNLREGNLMRYNKSVWLKFIYFGIGL
jgi:hypothetical protein